MNKNKNQVFQHQIKKKWLNLKLKNNLLKLKINLLKNKSLKKKINRDNK